MSKNIFQTISCFTRKTMFVSFCSITAFSFSSPIHAYELEEYVRESELYTQQQIIESDEASTKQETEIFTAMQNNAVGARATAQDLWYYSLIIREPRARKLLNLQISQQQADIQADRLEKKAYAQGDLSAVVKIGYDNIVKGIGQPTFIKEEGEYYLQFYKHATVKNSKALSEGLSQLTTALKDQCFVDYQPTMDYPFYYHHVYEETGKITMNNSNRPIGDRLYKFPHSALAKFPKIENQLDVITLRIQLHCEKRAYALNMLAGHLTHQENIDEYIHYSANLPNEQSELRQQVYLAVLSELVNMSELIPVFEYRVADEDKNTFNKQRTQLLADYRQAFAYTIPKDKYVDR